MIVHKSHSKCSVADFIGFAFGPGHLGAETPLRWPNGSVVVNVRQYPTWNNNGTPIPLDMYLRWIDGTLIPPEEIRWWPNGACKNNNTDKISIFCWINLSVGQRMTKIRRFGFLVTIRNYRRTPVPAHRYCHSTSKASLPEHLWRALTARWWYMSPIPNLEKQ